MPQSPPFQFSLHPALEKDVREAVDIFDSAFASNRYYMLVDQDTQKYRIDENSLKGILSWPGFSATKAVSDVTGEIIGFTFWERRTASSPWCKYRPLIDTGDLLQQAQDGADRAIRLRNDPVEDENNRESMGDLLDRIETLYSDYYSSTTCDDICIVLHSIAVRPTHQSHGVGSALLRQATTAADNDGLSCWVHTSEAGHSMYAKAGFVEVGSWVVDLDELNPTPYDEEDKSKKWGLYKHRYMKRPVTQGDHKGHAIDGNDVKDGEPSRVCGA